MSTQSMSRGVSYMLMANVAYCAMVCLVKYAAAVNVFTTTMFRFLIGLALMGLLAISGRVNLRFVNKRGLLVRGIMGGVAVCIGFISIGRLGVIESSLIVNLYPIFAVLFGILILREKLSVRGVAGIVLALCGVTVLVVGKGHGMVRPAHAMLFELLAFFGAALGGLTVVLVKKLQSTESTSSIFFAQCLMGFWIVLIPAASHSGPVGMGGAALLIGIGVLATAGQLVSTEAYRHISVAHASLLIMFLPVINCLAGVLLFGEQMNRLGVAGSVLVLIGSGVALIKR